MCSFNNNVYALLFSVFVLKGSGVAPLFVSFSENGPSLLVYCFFYLRMFANVFCFSHPTLSAHVSNICAGDIVKKSSNDVFLLLAILPFFSVFVHVFFILRSC
jgi:hypothetical protein